MQESKIQDRKPKTGVNPPARTITRILLCAIAVVVFAADQLSKHLVESRIPERVTVPVVKGFFNLVNTKNTGAVFGMFSESAVWWKTPLLIGISVALLITVVMLVSKTRNLHWSMSVGMALILGGALSNLFDRVRSGQVEDFLDFYFRSYHWYTFNVADSAIVVGTGLIVLQVLLGE
jgi:signal peptidase II